MEHSTPDDIRLDRSHWQGRLRGLAQRARHSVTQREADFLRLGGRLQEFAGASDNLLAAIATLARLAEGQVGESSEDAAGGLAGDLEAMAALLDAGQGQAAALALTRLEEVLAALAERNTEFKNVVKHLQMLGISTRIESARLGSLGTGFLTLADDVEALAQRIVDQSTRLQVGVQSLQSTAGEARQRQGDMGLALDHCRQAVGVRMQAGLTSLDSLAAASRQAAVEAEGLAADITARIGAVVASLQYHDIVRQQLEHVAHALDDMVAVAQDPAEAPREVLAWIRDASALEVRQVDTAAASFLQAVDRLEDNLTEVASLVDSLTAGVRASMTGTGAGGVFASIRRELSQATDAVGQVSAQAEALAGGVDQVTNDVSGMARQVEVIEEMRDQIELIAINASIKAAHTGDGGRALGVLAQAIQSLSVRTGSVSAAVAGQLTTVDGASRELREEARRSLDQERFDHLLERVGHTVESFDQVSQDMAERFAAVASAGEELSQDVGREARGVAVHRQVGAELQALRQDLTRLGAEAGALLPPGVTLARPERLTAMIDRYTMEVERLVHLGQDAADPAVSSAADGPEDGIEWF